MSNPLPTAFDDDGRPVPSVDFDFDAVEQVEDETETAERVRSLILAGSAEAIHRLLMMLVDGADIDEAGRRAHALAFIAKCHPAQTQVALAEQLRISQPTASRCIAKMATGANVFGPFANRQPPK